MPSRARIAERVGGQPKSSGTSVTMARSAAAIGRVRRRSQRAALMLVTASSSSSGRAEFAAAAWLGAVSAMSMTRSISSSVAGSRAARKAGSRLIVTPWTGQRNRGTRAPAG